MSFFIIGCIFVITILYLILTTMKPSNYAPGPRRWPIVGNSILLRKLSKELGGLYKAFLKLQDDYKSNIISLKLGNDEYVVVFGRKLVQQVFTRDEFQARPDSFGIRLRSMGARRGITMTDGKLWHEQRNFAERQLRQLGFGKTRTENLIRDELMRVFDILGDEQKEIRLNEKISSSFIDVLWTITGGKQLSEDRGKLDELLQLLRARCRAFDVTGGILNQLPWLRFIAPDYCGYTCIQTLNAKLLELFQENINEHKRTIEPNETRDFIDAYLHEKEVSNPNTSTFTDEQLVAVCLDFFIAGIFTTNYTLDFAILATLRNPRVQRKLYEELNKVLTPKEIPSISDKARLPYVEALLLESQRFQHVVPVVGPRRVLKDTSLDGYYIPKNTLVMTNLKSVHYDTEIWHDPEVFRPERFLTEDGKFIQDEGLCTFGLGKRRCTGEILAKSFLFLAFTALFNRYMISIPEGREPSSKLEAGILVIPPPYVVNLQAR